ncbi:MAG: host-nuclease inhibitor Gam family protein [Rhodospirillales bacterium]
MAKTKKLTAPAAPVPQNENEANEVLNQLGIAVRGLEGLIAKRDAAAAEVVAKHQEGIDKATAEAAARMVQLQAYGEANKTALLGQGKRSISLPLGSFGWRFGPPAVKLDKDFEEEDAIAALQRAGLLEFVRTREELDRESILTDREKIADLRGFEIEQSETFWAKPLSIADALTAKARKLKGSAVQKPDDVEPKKSKKKDA